MVKGVEDIKQSKWFQGVQWSSVMNKEIVPPWVPELENGADDQYFEEYPDSGSVILEPSAEEQKLFDDF